MTHEATLIYDRPLLKRAVLAFWKRSVGLGVFIALALVGFGLVSLLQRGDASWVVGALATCAALAIVFVIALYVVHYRNVMCKLRDMGKPQAQFRAEESSFTFTSGVGTSTMRWSMVTEVWCFPDFWLMLFSKAHFVTIPLASLAPEMQAFVIERVRASGGKILPR